MTSTDLEGYAHHHGLERVGARPALPSYLAQAWRRREFAMTMARYRLQAAMSENRLGMGWVVLRPILNAVLFGTIFGLILPASTRPENFIPYMVVGFFIFEFFAKTLGMGAKAIVGAKNLVRTLAFPRILLPVAQVLRQVVELVPMLIVMAVILLLFGMPVTWGWLMVVPVMVLMTLFNTGIALITARLTVHARDVSQVIPLVSRVVFYSSGIFYSLDQVLADQPGLLQAAQLNPVYVFISLVRGYTVDGQVVEPSMWWIGVAAALGTFLVGIVFFWQAEERYGRD